MARRIALNVAKLSKLLTRRQTRIAAILSAGLISAFILGCRRYYFSRLIAG